MKRKWAELQLQFIKTSAARGGMELWAPGESKRQRNVSASLFQI